MSTNDDIFKVSIFKIATVNPLHLHTPPVTDENVNILSMNAEDVSAENMVLEGNTVVSSTVSIAAMESMRKQIIVI